MKSICVLLTIMAVVQVTQPKTSAQTPTDRSIVVEQHVLGCPDRIAVIEYVPERDKIVITNVNLNQAREEYARLTVKTDRTEQDYRRFVALLIAIGTYRT